MLIMILILLYYYIYCIFFLYLGRPDFHFLKNQRPSNISYIKSLFRCMQ
jgi:hypothetical protein